MDKWVFFISMCGVYFYMEYSVWILSLSFLHQCFLDVLLALWWLLVTEFCSLLTVTKLVLSVVSVSKLASVWLCTKFYLNTFPKSFSCKVLFLFWEKVRYPHGSVCGWLRFSSGLSSGIFSIALFKTKKKLRYKRQPLETFHSDHVAIFLLICSL